MTRKIFSPSCDADGSVLALVTEMSDGAKLLLKYPLEPRHSIARRSGLHGWARHGFTRPAHSQNHVGCNPATAWRSRRNFNRTSTGSGAAPHRRQRPLKGVCPCASVGCACGRPMLSPFNRIHCLREHNAVQPYHKVEFLTWLHFASSSPLLCRRSQLVTACAVPCVLV